MQIQTEAFLLGKQNIHSTKSGKDFVKFSMIIEGDFCSFFTRAQEGGEIAKAKPCVDFEKTHNPTKCVATIEFKFTDKGVYADLRGIS